tara:strand:+ start:2494 stop:3336 length:843 start_codon:yes stop_codon:yes gene_type:complete
MNINDAIKLGNEKLKKNNIKSANLDSEIIMSEVLKKDRKYLILNSRRELFKNELNNYQDLIVERSFGKPIAYITGKKEFWKFEFKVSQGVLIPRPDTEIIVDQILKLTANKFKLKLLDIGVGSGCILLSILKEKKSFYGVGIDVSKKCIEISKINAKRLNLKNRAKFFKSNIDNFNYGKYDLIISNPPYIKKLDLKNLEKDVLNFEPIIALDGGLDGILAIRRTIEKASELIKKNGLFILEIAFDQKDKVKKILKDKGFFINNILKDFAGKERCIVCRKI